MDDSSPDVIQPVAPVRSPVLPVFRYAGFGVRLIASCIDAFVLVVAYIAIALFFSGGLNDSLEGAPLDGKGIAAFVPAINMLVSFLYFVLFECSSYQATPGKMALGLKVIDTTARRISFARSLARWFGKIISGAIFGIGFLMIAFSEKKQGLHDRMAGTFVVKGR
jgi:uncharacterized RDD family membrane protein YckC